MIGKVVKPGKGFRGLINYLLLGPRDAKDPDNRVAWIELHNLLVRDPLLVPAVMRATAVKSQRVKVPVYHFVVSWHETEAPSEEVMRQVANVTCSDLGLDEYQKLFVAHHDKAHRHVHIVVNRVHPETGVAWRTSKDYERIELSLRRQSEDLGLDIIPGRHADKKSTPTRRAKSSELHKARREGKGDPCPQWSREKVDAHRDSLLAIFDAAHSWTALCRALATKSMVLDYKGQGLVIGDEEGTMKLSLLGKTIRIAALIDRFGETYDTARHAVAPTPVAALSPQQHLDPECFTPTPAISQPPNRHAIPPTVDPTATPRRNERAASFPRNRTAPRRDASPHATAPADVDHLTTHQPRYVRPPNSALDLLAQETRIVLFHALDTAPSWHQLSLDLHHLGFRLSPKNGRPTLTSGNASFSIRDLHPTLTIEALEDRFHQPWQRFAETDPDIIDHLRQQAEHTARQKAPQGTDTSQDRPRARPYILPATVLAARQRVNDIVNEPIPPSFLTPQKPSPFARMIAELFQPKPRGGSRPLITERDLIFAFKGMGLISAKQLRDSLDRLATETAMKRNPLIAPPRRDREH